MIENLHIDQVNCRPERLGYSGIHGWSMHGNNSKQQCSHMTQLLPGGEKGLQIQHI